MPSIHSLTSNQHREPTLFDGGLLIPDPTDRLDNLYGRSGTPNLYAERASHKRALIFAATRRLIQQCGLPKVTIRSIAEHSGNSVQTLYNLVGDRERIIVCAINEHIDVLWRSARRATGYPNAVLAITDAYYATCALQGRYSLNTLSSPSPNHIFHPKIEEPIIKSLSDYLCDLLHADDCDTRNALKALSRRIILLTVATIVDWGGREDSHEVLRAELQIGISSLMLPWMPIAMAEQTRAWIDGGLRKAIFN